MASGEPGAVHTACLHSPRWALRSDLIDPAIDVHRGRVVKRTGDGLLAEFRSVVDAVRCAIELQHGAIERNAGAG
jgi:adenylate cyclase